MLIAIFLFVFIIGSAILMSIDAIPHRKPRCKVHTWRYHDGLGWLELEEKDISKYEFATLQCFKCHMRPGQDDNSSHGNYEP